MNTTTGDRDAPPQPSLPGNVAPLGLYTVEQSADYLKVSPRWVAERARQHLVPHTRLGRFVRFTRAQLDAIAAAGEQQVSAQAARMRNGTARTRL